MASEDLEHKTSCL